MLQKQEQCETITIDNEEDGISETLLEPRFNCKIPTSNKHIKINCF